jgi:hypothetical protein
VALAAAAFALNAWQGDREQKREDRRPRDTRLIAIDARREEVLRAYLQNMSGLMLHEGLVRSPRYSAVQKVARTVTLTALRRLDPERKGLVVRFLDEARLIDASSPKVNLRGADLRRIRLRDLYLTRPHFRRNPP